MTTDDDYTEFCRKTQTQPQRKIIKGWGREGDGIAEIFAYHRPQENLSQQIKVDTVKLLHMGRGKRLSIHYHKEKSEYFIVIKGIFFVEFLENNTVIKQFLHPEDRIFVPAGMEHRIMGIEDENILLEVSSLDSDSDSYRIEKGD